jgi:peptidyl-tRNA hydrolase, PTH1 family
MKLIVGLGNPGKKYASTRHNLGWMVMDAFAKNIGVGWSAFNKGPLEFCKFAPDVILIKPQTFMNESGKAVSALFSFYKVSPADLIIVHDELDLPFGSLRISFDASAGGHNGVKSVIDAIGSQAFTRLRLGVKTDRRDKVPADAFVLERFGLLERLKLNSYMPDYLEALQCLIENDPQKCMTRYNQ